RLGHVGHPAVRPAGRRERGASRIGPDPGVQETARGGLGCCPVRSRGGGVVVVVRPGVVRSRLRSSAVLRSRTVRAGLVLAGLGAVLTAPLAVSGARPADAVTISGARTLSDKVSVTWQHDGGTHRTTDVHVLAWNDFHGNLEPAGLTIYGHF